MDVIGFEKPMRPLGAGCRAEMSVEVFQNPKIGGAREIEGRAFVSENLDGCFPQRGHSFAARVDEGAVDVE